MELEKRKTLGEQRIRVSLEDQNEVDFVSDLKKKIAIIIDQVNSIEQKGSEHGRLKAMAITELESASMWITKALTYEF